MGERETTFVELDDRKRAALGRLADHQGYLVSKDKKGRILLEPASVITETERRLLEDPAFWDRVGASLDLPSKPLVRGRRSPDGG